VVEGELTMLLGDPVERVELVPPSSVVVEPGTPLQLRNESRSDAVVFAYGAPEQPADYKAETLADV
jgi:mannose-6-phosphate isomerase-like protein (cupin superfamily)